MSFKSKTLGLVAALGLSVSAIMPALAVDVNNDSETLQVTLLEAGIFAVSIDAADLDDSSVSATTTDVTSNGFIHIKYEDTKSYRAGFDVEMFASDFTSSLAIPHVTPATTYSIPAANLEIARNYDSYQGRWSSQGPRIGDIGPTSHGDDNDHSGGPYVPGNVDTTYGRYHDWTGVQNNDLANDGNPPLVGFGFAGPGTAGAAIPYGSLQRLEIKLDVPDAQPATTYTSTLTVTVTFGWEL